MRRHQRVKINNSDNHVSLKLPSWDLASENNRIFANNLDHLKYLELEMVAQIALSNQHESGIVKSQNKSLTDLSSDNTSKFPDTYNEPEIPGILDNHLSKIRASNRQREVDSVKAGISLNFLDVCQAYHLDRLEREIVLLLFLKNTSQTFRKLAEELDKDDQSWFNSGMHVGLILNILSADFVDQLKNRRYFSIDSTLIKHEIIVGDNDSYDDRTSILDETFCLHQRITNFIIGDHNAYSFDLKCINKVNIEVDIDQVILKKGLKQNIIESAEDYLKLSSGNNDLKLKDFFGYGTGLTYLFHGPSGTGKSMMAYALAQKLGRDILNLNLGASHHQNHSIDDLIKYAFKEAKLSDSILFFDECDDLFEEDSHESLVLLTEIEKAECITIMATNKVIRLDPSMDRRITMKVPFSIPGENERKQIWKALIPPQVRLSDDVSFKSLAQKYVFTGGIIKNTILTALSKAANNTESGQVKLTMPGIKMTADEQANQLLHSGGFGKVYEPSSKLEDLMLDVNDSKDLKSLADHTKKLNRKKTGISILITSSDIATGIKAVDGIAAACGRYVRMFSLSEVLLGPKAQNLKNPLTHDKIESFDYVFSTLPGHQTMTVIVDSDGKLEHHQNSDPNEGKPISEFFERVRSTDSTIFMVSPPWRKNSLPKEISHMIRLNYPPTEMQIRRWMLLLKEFGVMEEDVIEMVVKHPMHTSEIDFYVQQAKLESVFKHGDQSRTVNYIDPVIKRYRKTVPILFG
jgi:DNA polymerase III delta prime subunit